MFDWENGRNPLLDLDAGLLREDAWLDSNLRRLWLGDTCRVSQSEVCDSGVYSRQLYVRASRSWPSTAGPTPRRHPSLHQGRLGHTNGWGVVRTVAYAFQVVCKACGRCLTLSPDTLMETTFSHRKSHSRSGTREGARKPPLAASMWIGQSIPFFTRRSLTPLTSSYSPVQG